jgi:hypothetical protein
MQLGATQQRDTREDMITISLSVSIFSLPGTASASATVAQLALLFAGNERGKYREGL